MAITDASYSDKAISEEQVTTLKELLLQKVEDIESVKISLRFVKCRLRGSMLLISSFDQATKDSLERQIQHTTGGGKSEAYKGQEFTPTC